MSKKKSLDQPTPAASTAPLVTSMTSKTEQTTTTITTTNTSNVNIETKEKLVVQQQNNIYVNNSTPNQGSPVANGNQFATTNYPMPHQTFPINQPLFVPSHQFNGSFINPVVQHPYVQQPQQIPYQPNGQFYPAKPQPMLQNMVQPVQNFVQAQQPQQQYFPQMYYYPQQPQQFQPILMQPSQQPLNMMSSHPQLLPAQPTLMQPQATAQQTMMMMQPAQLQMQPNPYFTNNSQI